MTINDLITNKGKPLSATARAKCTGKWIVYYPAEDIRTGEPVNLFRAAFTTEAEAIDEMYKYPVQAERFFNA